MLVHIQILRFLAAAGVVAFHAWGVAPNYIAMPKDTHNLVLENAGHGVDLFFVISGFIIYFSTHRSPHGPAAFLRRRVERIVPFYFFAILLVTALAILLPATFGEPGWYTPQHILKSLAFISFTDGQMPVVYVGWSLEYEMYFYLCAALLLALSRNPWRDLTLLFCGLAAVGQLPGVREALGNHAFFVDPLVLEFVLGVLAGKLFVHGRIGGLELGAVAVAFALLAFTEPNSRAIVFGLPSALLVAGAAWISRRRQAPSRAEHALERLGDASYAIYLAQVNTVTLTSGFIAAIWPGILPLALVAGVTAVVVALGLALNIAVERPLLAFCRSIGRTPQAARA